MEEVWIQAKDLQPGDVMVEHESNATAFVHHVISTETRGVDYIKVFVQWREDDVVLAYQTEAWVLIEVDE